MKSHRASWFPVTCGLAVVLVAIAAVGCGGGGDGASTVTDATPTNTQPTTIPSDVHASGDQEFAVAVLAAIDVVDSAGFHDMAKALAESEEINPRFADGVSNVLTAAKATEWPISIQVESAALIESLESLLAALQDEDLQGARAAAEGLHDTQHDASEAAYEWLKTVPPVDGSSSDTATVSIIAAVDIIDSAGFHDMAKELESATEVNPRFAGTVDRALTAARFAGWSGEIATPASQLTRDLQQLLAALEAGDLAAAVAAVEAVHGSQHDTSEAAYAWLASNHGLMGHDDALLTAACEIKAVDAVDSVGFHDMAKDLAQASEINPRYAGRIANALAVLAFNGDRAGDATMHISSQMTALHEALAAGDLESARELAEAVHDAQHDFSEEMYGRMGAMHGPD